jgi:hypothetical protein
MIQNINTLNICYKYRQLVQRFGIARLQRIQIYINSLGFIKFLKRYTRSLPSGMARPKLCQLIFICMQNINTYLLLSFLTSAAM